MILNAYVRGRIVELEQWGIQAEIPEGAGPEETAQALLMAHMKLAPDVASRVPVRVILEEDE
jgi:hypothetical protein